MVYTIIINEAQRQRIQRALEVLDAVDPPNNNPNLEYEYLTDMVRDLPQEEAKNPGVGHGLCY